MNTVTTASAEPETWNTKDVADYLRISVWQVRKLAKQGVLPGIRVGDWRFHRPAIMAMMKGGAQ